MIQNRIFYLILLVSFIGKPFEADAQNYEWLINTKSTFSEYISKTILDKSGNSYSIGGFEKFIQFNNDSTRFTNKDISAFVVKYNKNGNMLWLRSFTSGQLLHLAIDSSDNLIIYGDTRDTFNTNVGYISAIANQTVGFILKLNSTGNPILLKSLGLNSSVSVLNLRTDLSGNAYLVGYMVNSFYIDGILVTKIGPANLTGDGFIAKYNSTLNSISWVRKASNCIFNDVDVDESGHQYITGTLSGISPPNHISTFGNISHIASSNDAFISKINSLGQYIWVKKISGLDVDQGKSIIYKSGKLYFIGLIIGNVDFNSTAISCYPLGTQNGYIAVSDTSGNIINVKLFKGINSMAVNFHINNFNEIILIGVFNSSLNLDNFRINSTKENSIFLAKLDLKLNGLWLLDVNSTGDANSVISSNEREYYFSGNLYTNYIQFGPYYRDLNFTSNNGFLVKISDISITQIPPLKRNYCSGDSIFVGFSTTGKFKLGNKFSVQLSDSIGLFDSVKGVIGFRIDTVSNIIGCKLPSSLFSSSYYKLRIFSDSPGVVSYYDSMFYTIQNSPTVDAGLDTLVCFGRSVSVGSNQSLAKEYLWQPFNLVTDSSQKRPFTKLGLTAGFNQLVLKASNDYCIVWDTINLNVLKPLKIYLTSDTLVCKNTILIMNPVFIGGMDSKFYQYSWFKNSYSLSVGSNNSLAILADSNYKYFLIFNDGCSLPDTSNLILEIADYIKPKIFEDTFVCINKYQSFYPAYNFSNKKGFSLKWFDENWNLKSAQDTFIVKFIANTTNYVISNHLCKLDSDTLAFKVKVLPELNFKLMEDTILCQNRNFKLHGTAYGGDSTNYKISWNLIDNDTLIGWNYDILKKENKFERIYNFSRDTFLIATISDNCSIETKSDSIFISIIPNLAQSIPLTKVCEGEPIWVKSLPKYGKLPYHFTWYDTKNDSILGTNESLYILKAEYANYKLKVLDDCKNADSIIVLIDPDLKPDVNFVADKTLVSTSNGLVSFKNLSQNSEVINYNWSFGNGDSSSEFESSYTYNSTGKFAVSLTAMSSIGCKSSLIKLDYIIVGSNKNVFLPNAITLNDNELNDEFLPIGDGVKAWQLEVYDRRGFLLFEGNEVVGGFKGLDRNGVIVVDDVLIYKITITTIDSEKISIINNLTILR